MTTNQEFVNDLINGEIIRSVLNDLTWTGYDMPESPEAYAFIDTLTKNVIDNEDIMTLLDIAQDQLIQTTDDQNVIGMIDALRGSLLIN